MLFSNFKYVGAIPLEGVRLISAEIYCIVSIYVQLAVEELSTMLKQ